MMTTRELYREKYTAQIHEWAAQLELLHAQQQQRMTAEARIAAQPHLDACHVGLQRARAKLAELGDATEDTWEALMRGAEDFWSETKAALEGAADAVAPTQPKGTKAPS
jgi:hypothetical protein